MNTTSISYTLTDFNVTVFLDGNSRVISSTHSQYNIIVEALKNDDVQAIRNALNVKETIVAKSNGKVTIENNNLMYDGEVLRNALTVRILKMLGDGFDVTPFTNFLNALMLNPSKRAVDELYGFLEACNLPITSDGCFLAYKLINRDYRDIYTNTFDNSVGQTVSMERNKVDDNKERTCSDGLHVCSQSYLPKYGGFYGSSDSRIVVCKINPKDVVSVPVDYNNAKMRVCEYSVVQELFEDDVITDDFTSEFEDDVNTHSEPDDEIEDFYQDDGQTDVFGYDDDFDDKDDDFDDDFDDNFDDKDDDFDDVEDVPEDVPVVRSTRNLYSDDQVIEVFGLLQDGWTLTAISKATDISIRQIARYRDGLARTDLQQQFKDSL